MPSILVVDDEPGVRSSISGVLKDEGFDVDTAETGESCLEKANDASYDVIVLDIWLPGLDGLTTLQRLRERQIDSQVVIISGHGNIESAVRAIKMGAFDFIEKSLSLEKTVLVVRNALRQRDLEAENRVLRAKVDRQQQQQTMVGESPAMSHLRPTRSENATRRHFCKTSSFAALVWVFKPSRSAMRRKLSRKGPTWRAVATCRPNLRQTSGRKSCCEACFHARMSSKKSLRALVPNRSSRASATWRSALRSWRSRPWVRAAIKAASGTQP